MGDLSEVPTELARTSRDPEQLRAALTAWFADRLPATDTPQLLGLGSTAANGMSSETLLFEVHWTDEAGTRHVEDLVARVEPSTTDLPVFPSYDLGHQWQVLTQVAELTDLPVPNLRWFEPDASVIGAPFFLMDRVDGQVPPDVAPYTFGDNWLFDATPAQQRQLQDQTVAVLATLHGIDRPTERFAHLAPTEPGDTPLRRHVAHTRAWYDFAAADVGRSPLVDAGFAWLEAHWPAESAPVLLWGDARIGNVLYRDFSPAAVLDWEMASIGPRELDLGWLVFAHEVFVEIASVFELPPMPGFLDPTDVTATYAQLSGHTPVDLDWFRVYAAVQWGIVFLRTGARQAHFGEIELPEDLDALLHHRPLFERLLAD